MKVKALSLVFLVIFAAFATSIVIGLSTSLADEGNIGFTEPYSIEQVDGKVNIEPCGDEVDGPGMPT